MGFQHHPYWHRFNAIEQGCQKVILIGIRPTIAAGYQIDFLGLESCGSLEILIQLRQMIGRAPLQ